MPTLDFWVDWRIRAPVDALRTLLPLIARPYGYVVRETPTVSTSTGWAQFAVERDDRAGTFAVGRAQDLTDESQMFLAPGTACDDEALADLNRAALCLYIGLVARGLVDPPAPLEAPARPLMPRTQ